MPHVELPQAEFKVVMLGDTNAGKTSLVLRFAEGYYRDGARSSTVGAFFITKRIQTSNGITCKIQIWDTAGQAQFRAMAPMYYRNAAAAIVCYDVTSPKSFKVMREWLDELHRNVPAGSIVIAIAATKTDLVETAPTSDTMQLYKEAEELAMALGAIFVDTSAKSNSNVTVLFQRVAERVLQFRENAKREGTDLDAGGIPVTPGASINAKGIVVKKGNRVGGELMNGGDVGGPGENGGADYSPRNRQRGLNMNGTANGHGGEGTVGSNGVGGPQGSNMDVNQRTGPLNACDAAPTMCGVGSTASTEPVGEESSWSYCSIS